MKHALSQEGVQLVVVVLQEQGAEILGAELACEAASCQCSEQPEEQHPLERTKAQALVRAHYIFNVHRSDMTLKTTDI